MANTGQGEQGELLLLCPWSLPAVSCPLHSFAQATSATARFSELTHPLGPPARSRLPLLKHLC